MSLILQFLASEIFIMTNNSFIIKLKYDWFDESGFYFWVRTPFQDNFHSRINTHFQLITNE